MAHSYVSCLMHFIWSTKERRLLITPDIRERLWPYLGGIARQHDAQPIAIGGVEDHVHMLIGLPRTMAISKLVQLIKGGSSGWVHETFPDASTFQWQQGYGAFSVSISQRDATIRYINNQKDHHREVTFQDEYRAILRRHGIEWNEEHVWG